jgi:hypothetical protein
MDKKIIISQPWGGLGDNLQLSTIPEIAKSLGYEVYVSNQNTYRNQEIKELVWDMNPFIDGYTDEPGTIDWSKYKHVHGQVIKDVEEMVFGKLYTTNGKPKIYSPDNQKLEQYKNRIVIDPNAFTGSEIPKHIFTRYKSPILLNTEHEQYETITTKSIMEWVQIINSCKRFVCANSGGSVVAAALGKKADVYYKNSITHYKFNHNYFPL